MEISLTNSEMIVLSKIEPNKGQIEGLPKNPRFIKTEKFNKLKRSLADHPQMLALRELLVFLLAINISSLVVICDTER